MAASHRLHAKMDGRRIPIYHNAIRRWGFALPSYGSDKFIYNLPNPQINFFFFFFPHKEQYRKISSQPNSSRIDDRIHHNHQKPRKKKEIIFLDYSFSSATQKERKNIRVCLFVCLLPCLFPEEETATKRAVQSLNTEKSSADTERGQQPSTEFPHSLALSLPHSSF